MLTGNGGHGFTMTIDFDGDAELGAIEAALQDIANKVEAGELTAQEVAVVCVEFNYGGQGYDSHFLSGSLETLLNDPEGLGVAASIVLDSSSFDSTALYRDILEQEAADNQPKTEAPEPTIPGPTIPGPS